MYELFVGEIGLTRHEFLYDILFWEARRIVRGYRKRGKILMQLIAENIYATTHVMRPSEGKTVKDMFPVLFEDDDEMEPPMTEDEQEEMQQIMANINAAAAAENESKPAT